MALTIIDQFGKLLTNGFDVVETWERHIAIEIGGRGTWVDGEYLNRGVRLLEFNRHDTHHRVLSSLAGDLCQRMPVGTDL